MAVNKLRPLKHKEILKGTGFGALTGGAFGAATAAAHPDVETNKENLLETAGIGAAASGLSTLGIGYLLRRRPDLVKKYLANGMKKQGSLEPQSVANYVDALRR